MGEKILVLGCGAWGTTFGNLLAGAGHQVLLWGRDRARIAAYQQAGQQLDRAPGVALNPRLTFTPDLQMAIKSGVKMIVFALPTQNFAPFLENFKSLEPLPTVPYINLAKGINVERGELLSETFSRFFPHLFHRYHALSGPNLAGEILAGKPASAVIAGHNPEDLTPLINKLSSRLFRLYACQDIRGVEVAGAAKNIFAIASGVCEGLGLGSNARAALLTRSLTEMVRLGEFFGGKRETFFGLSGLGDIMTTCFSPLSRNFNCGLQLAKGRKIDDILRESTSVVEGVTTTRIVYEISLKHEIYMPITRETHKILFSGSLPIECVERLMTLEPKMEHV